IPPGREVRNPDRKLILGDSAALLRSALLGQPEAVCRTTVGRPRREPAHGHGLVRWRKGREWPRRGSYPTRGDPLANRKAHAGSPAAAPQCGALLENLPPSAIQSEFVW